tara:strand:+ start:2170 stop:2325 length:156 start_codon:yes stop_codon:yes gene_type:complete
MTIVTRSQKKKTERQITEKNLSQEKTDYMKLNNMEQRDLPFKKRQLFRVTK